jgi:dihydrofolate synthase/folylpolyglutamate synthase
VDYRERIRLNGLPCSKEFVVDFVETWRSQLQRLELSFFEMSVGMAFVYFRDRQVDVAVVEVGMGGRLDSTNVLHPLVAAVTNIDLDHQAFLGSTRAAIAAEKAGIFKAGVPAIVGERHPETEGVFRDIAERVGAPLQFAEDLPVTLTPTDLLGSYQAKNQRLARAILGAQQAFPVSEDCISRGLLQVAAQTGLQGRWQVVSQEPFTVLDTAHNAHGLQETMAQFRAMESGAMHIVFGMVGDKDADGALALLPKEARYYFCAPSIPRALPVADLQRKAATFGLHGEGFSSVHHAWEAALETTEPGDRIYIGGSTFVVADALTPKSAS